MQLYGPVIGFELADKAAAERFFAASQLVSEATSFGGIHTSAERRLRWNADAVSEGFIRLSIGIEDVQDLLADFAVALASAQGTV
jgi:cystathionine gamma-lyase